MRFWASCRQTGSNPVCSGLQVTRPQLTLRICVPHFALGMGARERRHTRLAPPVTKRCCSALDRAKWRAAHWTFPIRPIRRPSYRRQGAQRAAQHARAVRHPRHRTQAAPFPLVPSRPPTLRSRRASSRRPAEVKIPIAHPTYVGPRGRLLRRTIEREVSRPVSPRGRWFPAFP